MTDLDTLLAMFTRVGVPYTRQQEDDLLVVTVEAKSYKVGGYSGFFTEFYFSMDGEFREMAIYE